MTPKEKAEELYCKYIESLNIRDLQITTNPFAKQCALIAVDEVMQKILWDKSEHRFWLEVKQELENK